MEIRLKNTMLKKEYKALNFTFNTPLVYGLYGESELKNELLETILGVKKAYDGEIIVGDKIYEKDDFKNKNVDNIGYASKNPYDYFLKSTIEDEIQFFLKSKKYNKKVIDEAFKKTVELLDINDLDFNKNPFDLSYGEAKLVSFANALIHNPTIILLDEPCLGLDFNNSKKIIRVIKRLKHTKKKLIIISSSNPDFLMKVSDEIIAFDDKTSLLSGDKKSVFMNTSIKKPKTIEFIDYVNKTKRMNIGYREDINDLMKDVYRYAKQ